MNKTLLLKVLNLETFVYLRLDDLCILLIGKLVTVHVSDAKESTLEEGCLMVSHRRDLQRFRDFAFVHSHAHHACMPCFQLFFLFTLERISLGCLPHIIDIVVC